MLKQIKDFFSVETYVKQWREKLDAPNTLTQSQQNEFEKLKNYLFKELERRGETYTLEMIDDTAFRINIGGIKMICLPVVRESCNENKSECVLMACIYGGFDCHFVAGDWSLIPVLNSFLN